MKAMLKNADKISALGETPQMINLASVVSLKQVRFVASTVKAEDGTQTVAATSADVTVWLGFQRAAGQAVTYFMKNSGVGWASGLARWLGDVFLPENLYVTMSVPLLGDGTTKLVINDMNASEHARASKLINGSFKDAGTSTLDELLVDLTEKIKPYLKTATEHMDFYRRAARRIEFGLARNRYEIGEREYGGRAAHEVRFDIRFASVAVRPERAT